jgi:hypothetical protein
MVAWIPLIALIVGILMYALASNAKVAEIGRLLFFAAFLALLIVMAPATVAKFFR